MFYHNPDIDKRIFSRKGGPFSPSKINIVLGQVAFVIWIVIFCFHSFFIFDFAFFRASNIDFVSETIVFSILFCLTCLAMIVVIPVSGLPMVMGIFNIKSRCLQNSSEENEYSNYTDALEYLENVRKGVLQNIGAVQTEIVKDFYVYLVIHISGVSFFKLDVSVKGNQIQAYFKRIDNKLFNQKDVSFFDKKNVKLESCKKYYKIGAWDKYKMQPCVEEIAAFIRKIKTENVC